MGSIQRPLTIWEFCCYARCASIPDGNTLARSRTLPPATLMSFLDLTKQN